MSCKTLDVTASCHVLGLKLLPSSGLLSLTVDGSWFCSGEVVRSSQAVLLGVSHTTPVYPLKTGTLGETLWNFILWLFPPSSFWANFVFCARYTRTYTHACVFTAIRGNIDVYFFVHR